MDDKTKQYTEKAKGWAGKAKRMSDSAVRKYGEKLPDSVTKAYDKASTSADKYLPPEGAAAAEESVDDPSDDPSDDPVDDPSDDA